MAERSRTGSTTDAGDDQPPAPRGTKASGAKGGRGAATQRLGDRLTAAQDEHRANAAPDSSSASTRAAKSSGRRPPRRARLRLTRLDPWSVMKTAFLLSIAFSAVFSLVQRTVFRYPLSR